MLASISLIVVLKALPALNLTVPLSVSRATCCTKLSAKTSPKAFWLLSNALLISEFSSCNSLVNTSNPASSANALPNDSLLPGITFPLLPTKFATKSSSVMLFSNLPSTSTWIALITIWLPEVLPFY